MSRAAILVVDDDADYRRLLREHLEALGYAVLEAEDGSCVSGTVRRENPSQGVDQACAYLRMASRFGADATFEKTRPVAEMLRLVRSLTAERQPVHPA